MAKYPEDVRVTLEPLCALSARLGSDVELTQGGGGNISIKIGDALWVKASGTWLVQAMDRQVLTHVSLSAIRDSGGGGGLDRLLALIDKDGLKPSIETSLHAVMPHRAVAHVHSVNAIAAGLRKDCDDFLAERLQGLSWASVGYAKPGNALADAVREQLETNPQAGTFVLKNHGLLLSADNCADLERQTLDVHRRLAVSTRPTPPGRPFSVPAKYRAAPDLGCDWVASDNDALAIAAGGTLYPDHVVFLGDGMPIYDDVTKVPPHRQDTALFIRGGGLAVRDDITAGAREMLRCLGLVLARLPSGARPHYLPQTAVAELMNWDAEKFRQALDRQGSLGAMP